MTDDEVDARLFKAIGRYGHIDELERAIYRAAYEAGMREQREKDAKIAERLAAEKYGIWDAAAAIRQQGE